MDIKEEAKNYEAATQYFADTVTALSDSDLDRHQLDGWSPRQVIHHLADSEAQSYARLRRLVAEPNGSIIQGYDEGLWASNKTLGYEELPVENSFAVYLSVRAASLDIIKRLTATDLEKYGEHSESGKYTVEKWLASYAKHPRDHADQIKSALA
ncbi:MAG: DinB family protein [Candidatus Nanopelagicaceae bacterium]|nr:DinB family protein [Candidatus Nanopelagicaceae bacterium]